MKRVMLITYYFPPCGGAPVQRWLRIVKYMRFHGIEVTVLTTQNGLFPFTDSTLKIPEGVKVIRAEFPSIDKLWNLFAGSSQRIPHGSISLPTESDLMVKVMVWIRKNMIIPDIRIIWNRNALKSARKVLSQSKYDAIITTGPPHSTHLIGLKLKKEFQITWFSDFRDPWVNIHYFKLNPPCAISRVIHKYLEKKVIENANCSFVVSDSISNQLPDGNKHVLYNSFDPDDFVSSHWISSDTFRIKYVGQLTAGQNIQVIFEFLREFSKHRVCEFSLVGTKDFCIDDEEQPMGQNFSLRITDFLTHDEAIKEMVCSDLLVLIINDYEGSQGMLTTKLFEYIASRTPILCFSQVIGEAAHVILGTISGQVFRYNETNRAVKWVLGLEYGKRNDGNIDAYSVVNQVDTLLNAFST